MRMQTFFVLTLKQIEEKFFLYVHMVDGGGQCSIMSARTKNFQLVAKVYEKGVDFMSNGAHEIKVIMDCLKALEKNTIGGLPEKKYRVILRLMHLLLQEVLLYLYLVQVRQLMLLIFGQCMRELILT